MIEEPELQAMSTTPFGFWKIRALVVAFVFIYTTPYFYLTFGLFHFEDFTNIFVLFFPWLALIYMAIYWVLDHRIPLYLLIIFTIICAPLAVISTLTGVGLLLLFPSIWLAVYLVRYHLKST